MASALGKIGTQQFADAKGNKKLAKITVAYIAQIAGAVGGITGDPQLQQIGKVLGAVSPQKAPPPPMEPVREEPPMEEPPEEPVTPPPVA